MCKALDTVRLSASSSTIWPLCFACSYDHREFKAHLPLTTVQFTNGTIFSRSCVDSRYDPIRNYTFNSPTPLVIVMYKPRCTAQVRSCAVWPCSPPRGVLLTTTGGAETDMSNHNVNTRPSTHFLVLRRLSDDKLITLKQIEV